MTSEPQLLPDALLIERIAALGDRAALGELDRRHGMTLYAIAYALLLDSDTSDTVVAAALRELWRQAASFDPRLGSAEAWLGELTRRAACARLRAGPREPGRIRAGKPVARPAAQPVKVVPPARRRRARGLARVVVARAARLVALLAVPILVLR